MTTDPAQIADTGRMTPEQIRDLVARLRGAAEGESPFSDTPWWWDSDEKGGPASILREAADALESLLIDGSGSPS